MSSKHDDFVLAAEDTEENANSFGSKAWAFISQFFLFLVVVFLAVLLGCQIITMSAVAEDQVKASQ